jgi:hypothetical protein
MHKTYKGRLIDLEPGQIAIAGTNTQGRHGKGFVLYCLQKFGAIYGQPRGLQGRCYGIVTKDLTIKKHPSRTPQQIKDEIKGLYEFGRQHPEWEFVSPYNCHDENLNSYSAQEMANFFGAFEIPSNFVFEEEFYKLIMNPQKSERDIDGLNHVNVYSKGNTVLGRLLSNFAETQVVLGINTFASVESWWYWIKMNNINAASMFPLFTDEQMAEVMTIPGNGAKSYFRKLYKDDSASFSPNKEQFKEICRAKLEQHPNVTELLLKNDLPLRHYYVMFEKVIEIGDYLWTLDVWNELKEELGRH